MLTPIIKSNINVVNIKNHTPTDYDVYIARPSILGNPYSHKKESIAEIIVDKRDDAIKLYKEHFYNNVDKKEYKTELDKIINIYKQYGKVNLVCFCKPKGCHGDIIKSYLESILYSVNIQSGT